MSLGVSGNSTRDTARPPGLGVKSVGLRRAKEKVRERSYQRKGHDHLASLGTRFKSPPPCISITFRLWIGTSIMGMGPSTPSGMTPGENPSVMVHGNTMTHTPPPSNLKKGSVLLPASL